jgi:hypothetical protein
MGRRFTLVAVTVLLGAGAAWAQNPAPQLSSSSSEYTDTVYATDQHMAFSIRNTLLHWLGGVSVAREKDFKASEKEGWWGEPVAQVSPELAQTLRSDR